MGQGRGVITEDGDLSSRLVFLIILCWCLHICFRGDYWPRYWLLSFSCLCGSFIPGLQFSVLIFLVLAECCLFYRPVWWVCVQEGMLANVEIWERRWAGRDSLSNPQGDIVRREVKLPTFHYFRSTVIGRSLS